MDGWVLRWRRTLWRNRWFIALPTLVVCFMLWLMVANILQALRQQETVTAAVDAQIRPVVEEKIQEQMQEQARVTDAQVSQQQHELASLREVAARQAHEITVLQGTIQQLETQLRQQADETARAKQYVANASRRIVERQTRRKPRGQIVVMPNAPGMIAR